MVGKDLNLQGILLQMNTQKTESEGEMTVSSLSAFPMRTPQFLYSGVSAPSLTESCSYNYSWILTVQVTNLGKKLSNGHESICNLFGFPSTMNIPILSSQILSYPRSVPKLTTSLAQHCLCGPSFDNIHLRSKPSVTSILLYSIASRKTIP